MKAIALAIAAATASFGVCQEAFAQGMDVEGAAEDIALYVSAGDYCGLPQHEAVNEIGNFYLKLDPEAFKRGSLKGVMIFKGLQSQDKSDVCSAAKISRPKIEGELKKQAAVIAAIRSKLGR